MSEPLYQHSCPSLNPMSFRLIYWIRWLCHGTCRYFMSQFFVSYTLLLIQSIGIFVLCSTGVILPIIFKAACTVQSAKCKLLTHLLPEVLLPWLIWFHKLTGEKLLRMDSEKKTDRKKIVKKERKKQTKTKKWNFKSLPGDSCWKHRMIFLVIIYTLLFVDTKHTSSAVISVY